MRAVLLSLAIGCCCVRSLPAEPPTSDAVRFDNEILELAFEGNDPGATIREYIPRGEKLDSWTRLAAIRTFDHIDDPAAYALATVEQLKKDYPQSPSSVLENPGNGDVILDFVVWPEDAAFVEFNVFQYRKRDAGGLFSQQYAVRAYGASSEEFLKNLRPLRERLVKAMAEDGLQPVDRPSPATAETAIP